MLDGQPSVVVTASDSNSVDFTTTMDSLAVKTALGTFVHDGSQNMQRSWTTDPSGSTAVKSHLSAELITQTHTIGTRTSSYRLGNFDWTMSKTRDAAGTLIARSHQTGVAETIPMCAAERRGQRNCGLATKPIGLCSQAHRCPALIGIA